MRRLLLLTVAMPLLVTTAAYGASGDRCEEARARDPRIGSELTDARVVNAATAAISKSRIEAPVVVCELLLPVLTATVENLGTSYYVGITRILVERFSDPELRAVLGHEMAHIVLGHRAGRYELTHHRSAAHERAADALSAKWFGKAPMRSVVLKLQADARMLPTAEQRRRAIAELKARQNALESGTRSKRP